MATESGAAPNPLRILYTAGWGRSGTTILGHILGQVRGYFFGGEMCYLGMRGWRQNQLCGCGKPFRECEMWSEIISVLQEETGEAGRLLLESIPGSVMRTRALIARLLPGRPGISRRLEGEIVGVLERLYRKIATVSHASIIVDTSKAPMYARLLEQIPGVELYVVHIVRDPRATAFSMGRRKYNPASGDFLPQAGRLRNAIVWLTWNLATEVLWNRRGAGARYLRIRYEDFARDPRLSLQAILDFVGLPNGVPPLSDNGEVAMRPTHSAAGNPDRLRTGTIQIRMDDEWKSSKARQRECPTVVLTWPLLLRYGYSPWA